MKSDLLNRISETIIRLITFDYLVIKKVIKYNLGKTDGKSIFDLGCGTGVLAPLFSPKSYMGIDIDPTLIEYAQSHHPRYKFEAGDATNVKLKNKFDIVLVVGVIHHLNNRNVKKFIDVIKMHLKKDGRVLIVEAIPPIFKWNLLSYINRKMDRGAFIRDLDVYKKFVTPDFKILKAYNQFGGAADYGVLLLEKR
ncbi:class I SAM-dependent methyltransferase [Candidatus Microgenomates bacterium]|nr:class I SAM-dependent methyltransferase [Candidatus Microgenomates bacterium]